MHAALASVLGLLTALPGARADLYTKNSPVLQVNAKDYDRLIARSNKTSIVEFYAPWCGHCQNLKPIYEKVAKNLDGIAKVAAVNCDDDVNKPFCGSHGVTGFPTLKIVHQRKDEKADKRSELVEEKYEGARTASAMVDAVIQRINDYVKKIDDKTVDAFLKEKNETAKAILFTEKGTTSALLKSVALDFLDVISVGQVRKKQAKTVELFGVDKFPTLLLLPGGDGPAKVFDGDLKRQAIVEFLSQAGSPNPDPAPLAKGEKKKEKKRKTATKEKTEKSEKKEGERETREETKEAPEDKAKEQDWTESEPQVPLQEAPVITRSALPIPVINSREKLVKECLNEKSTTCVLAFVPSSEDDKAKTVLASLADLALKYSQGNRHMFPFFEVHKNTEGVASILKALDLSGDVELVAINARRGWWRHFEAADFGTISVEGWIDSIRLSEGVKRKLPEGIVATVEEMEAEPEAPPEAAHPEVPEPEAEPEAVPEASFPEATDSASSEEAAPPTPKVVPVDASDASDQFDPTQATDPTVEVETEKVKHEEL